jgi:hypothetical protein
MKTLQGQVRPEREPWSARPCQHRERCRSSLFCLRFESGDMSPQTPQYESCTAERLHSKTLSRPFPALCSLWLIVFFAISAALASAQIQLAWVAKYNNGITNGNHQALKMTLDSAGNIYVLGVSANSNTNLGYVTIKYAPSGKPFWSARFDATDFPGATPTGFALDSSNNVIVTGNAVTLKYDGNGNLLWSAPYNATAISVDSGESIYITGVSGNFTTIRLNPDGSNLWTRTWTYQGLANMSQVIAVDSSSNVYVGGPETASVPPENQVNIAMLKYDPNGNQIWEDDLSPGGANGGARVVGLLLDTCDNIYFEANYLGPAVEPYSTYRYNSNGIGSAIAGNPTGNLGSIANGLALDTLSNMLVTGMCGTGRVTSSYGTYKIGTNGSYIWTNLYPANSSGASAATALAVDLANSVYVTGDSTNATSGSDIVTIKYDSNGNQVWVQRYDGPGHGNDAGNAIAVDNSGNVYLAGYETETNGFTSMILIKYSPVTIQKQSNGNVILHAYGSPGETFDIQASTNLQTWQDLGDVTADTNGLAQFDDTNAAEFTSRFYYTIPQ